MRLVEAMFVSSTIAADLLRSSMVKTYEPPKEGTVSS